MQSAVAVDTLSAHASSKFSAKKVETASAETSPSDIFQSMKQILH